MEFLVNLLALPIASGINLYATVLVLGLGQRFGWIRGLPEELALLADPIVLTAAGVLYLIEFFADKIPLVDTLWDGVHTFIRPAGAAFLALGAASEYGPTAQIMAMFVGAALGLGAHSTKAGTRLVVNTSPEPASNFLVSLAEDFGVVGLLALMFTYPWAALAVAVAFIVVMAWVTPLLFRTVRFLLAGVGGVLADWFGSSDTSPAVAPAWLREQIGRHADLEGTQAFPCFARSVPGAARFQPGYFVLAPDKIWYASRGLFGARLLPLAADSRPEVLVERRALFDVLVIPVETSREVRLCVAKNRSRLLQRCMRPEPGSPTKFASAQP